MLEENLCVFLKETEPRIIVNQRMLAICMELERTKKTKNKDQKTNYFRLKKENEATRDRITRDIKSISKLEEVKKILLHVSKGW